MLSYARNSPNIFPCGRCFFVAKKEPKGEKTLLALKTFLRKSLPAILSFVLIFSLFAPQVSKAADHTGNAALNEMIGKTVNYYKNKNETLESWWAIVALWGAGENLQDGTWKLPSWKTIDPKSTVSGTEYIRYIFALLAMGEDPAHAWETNRNLYAELAAQQNPATGAFGSTNKHMWAMLALDTGAKLGSDVGGWNAAAKQKALDYLLGKQLSDGGFAFFGSTSESDMTGMGLLALGNYQNDSAAQQSIERIKAFLKTKQLNNEQVMYGENSNSMSAVVSGLAAINEDVLSDPWTANGKSVLDSFALYQLQDGTFKWNESDTAGNGMATEQALIALTDIQSLQSVWYRFAEAKPPVPVAAELQVDGISGPIYAKQQVTIKNTEKPATALDLLKQALDLANPKISYKVVDSSFGSYVSSIHGQAAGSLGGWDGWMYEVNGIAPSVGADAYELKSADVVRFYYSRWPLISTAAQIANGAENPSVEVALIGDEFTEDAVSSNNWSIQTGNTELQVNAISLDGNKATVSFTGTAKGGTITLKALGAALVGNTDSDAIAVVVPRVLSGSTDQTIAINGNEKSVLITEAGAAPLTNNVSLTFATAALPKVTAERGNAWLEIPVNTVVTSAWNKVLQLPQNLSTTESGLDAKLNTALSSGSKKVDTIAVRIQAGGPDKIEFNQHVTLTIKGQGDKEAGFIDQSGVFTPIKKYSDSSVRADEVYAYSLNGDLIIKTKHFTEFLAYTASALTIGGGGGGLPAVQTITLSVEKRSLNEGDAVAPYAVTLSEGDTAFTALKRALEQKGVSLNYTGTGSSVYVQAIGGLAEFDHGTESGWMYSVNGVFPKSSAGAYTLKNGDVLRWQYTKDLGKDLGVPLEPGEPGEQLPGENPDPAVTPKYTDEAAIASWALAAVTKATELGFMHGTGAEHPKFEPKRQLTRAEFAALVVKYAGEEPLQADSGFKDVNKQAWYYGYVAAAKEKGLMSGISGTSFAPSESITRQEMAAVLVRLKGLADANAPQAAIKDRDAVSAWAVPFVNVAYQKGLMTGDNGLFNPQALVTREMAAVTIIRLHELK